MRRPSTKTSNNKAELFMVVELLLVKGLSEERDCQDYRHSVANGKRVRNRSRNLNVDYRQATPDALCFI